MTHPGGDLPGCEAALRALFAGEEASFAEAIKPWPEGLRTWVLRLRWPPARKKPGRKGAKLNSVSFEAGYAR